MRDQGGQKPGNSGMVSYREEKDREAGEAGEAGMEANSFPVRDEVDVPVPYVSPGMGVL